jgi:hypothetical protein
MIVPSRGDKGDAFEDGVVAHHELTALQLMEIS